MRVGFLGLGKLGFPVALSCAHQGHDVTGYDVVQSRMNLRPEDHPEIECGYGQFATMQDYLKGADITLSFGTLEHIVETSDIVFVAVQTPHDPLYEGATMLPASRKDFDYRYLKATIEHIANVGRTTPFDLCVISTVLPGTYERELKPILDKMPSARYFYTPQFIAMGTVMKDFLACPEPWLVGSDSYERGGKPTAGDNRIADFFRTLHNKPAMVMSVASAEACKCFYNTYITTKVTVANTIMDVCERIPGADCDDVADFLTSCNHRITSAGYMRPGMGDGGGCFLPDQMVWTSGGALPIEDIEPGDRVLSEGGQLRRVLETYKRPYKGTVKVIKARGLPPSVATPDHPFRAARDLRNVYLCNGKPKRQTTVKSSELVGCVVEIPVAYLTDDYYVLAPIPQEAAVVLPKTNYDLLTLCELAGYYLSEGSVDGRNNAEPKRVSFSFHAKETGYHAEVERLIKCLVGNDAHVSRAVGTTDKGMDLRVSNAALTRELVRLFGRGAADKTMPDWAIYGPEQYGRALMRGLWRGDGSSHKGGFSLSTISRDLVYGTATFLRRLGIIGSICKKPERTGKRDGVYHRPAYEFGVSNAVHIEALATLVEMPIGHKMQAKRYDEVVFVKGGYSYHKVQSVGDMTYEGTVWNLNVEDTHNYVVDAGIVANCHPRDNIALSHLARELGLPYDWFDGLMRAREEQAGLLAAELNRVASETALPICILGTAFKPNVGIETGSSALLVADILKTRHRREARLYDPHVEGRQWKGHLIAPHAYLVGCDHAVFDRLVLPEGSVLIDPFRKQRLARGSKVKVIAYGRGE